MKDYFSHDYYSRNDKKLVKVFMKYGLEAIGAYWCIIEMLYEEGGYLPLDEYERITFELRANEDLIHYIIFESDLFKQNEKVFWSESGIERLNLRAEKSEKARESIMKRWNRKGNTNVIQSNNEGNTSKVKESKVKESKEDNMFNSFWDDFHTITLQPKTDREPSLKYWNKLTNDERQKAIDSIKPYYDSITDKKYVKKARTYLGDKNFNDEFKKPKKVHDNNGFPTTYGVMQEGWK